MRFGSVLMSASAICVFGMCLHNHDAAADDSVIVNCDPSVDRGMIIMSDPPTVNCKDLRFFNMFVGSGLEFGPIADMDDLEQQLTELPSPPVKAIEGAENNSPNKTTFEVRRDLAYQELDDFNAANLDDGDILYDFLLLGEDKRPQITFKELTNHERMKIAYGNDTDGNLSKHYCSGHTGSC